jgi:hypothetical protein
VQGPELGPRRLAGMTLRQTRHAEEDQEKQSARHHRRKPCWLGCPEPARALNASSWMSAASRHTRRSVLRASRVQPEARIEAPCSLASSPRRAHAQTIRAGSVGLVASVTPDNALIALLPLRAPHFEQSAGRCASMSCPGPLARNSRITSWPSPDRAPATSACAWACARTIQQAQTVIDRHHPNHWSLVGATFVVEARHDGAGSRDTGRELTRGGCPAGSFPE